MCTGQYRNEMLFIFIGGFCFFCSLGELQCQHWAVLCLYDWSWTVQPTFIVKYWFISLSLPERQLVNKQTRVHSCSKLARAGKAGKGDEPWGLDISVSPGPSALCLRIKPSRVSAVLHPAWTFPMEFPFTGRKVVNCYWRLGVWVTK